MEKILDKTYNAVNALTLLLLAIAMTWTMLNIEQYTYKVLPPGQTTYHADEIPSVDPPLRPPQQVQVLTHKEYLENGTPLDDVKHYYSTNFIALFVARVLWIGPKEILRQLTELFDKVDV